MVLLSLQNISRSFGINKVLEDINLTLQSGDRMGLVGVNGSGKSTLLHIINGDLAPDEGTVTVARGVTKGLLTQQADITEDGTLWQELARVFEPLQKIEQKLRDLEQAMASPDRLGDFDALSREYARLTERYEREGGYEWRSRIQGVLAGLGFAKDRQDQPARLLSGGEKTRLCLARILLIQPELLMLDEPTNHLDLESTRWLEEALKDYKGTILVISHDRYFLNEVCNQMAEVRNRHLTQFSGNYDTFAVKREEYLQRQIKEYQMQQAEIRRQQAIIDRYRMYNREKSIRAAESREKRLNRMERLEKPVDEARVRFSFTARRRSGDDVLMVRGMKKSFDGRVLFENFSLTVRAGERVAIIGPNGVGKSTLLNCITGRMAPDEGSVIWGANVDAGYYDQQQSTLHPDKDIMQEVWDDFPRMEPDRVRSTLALFLLTGDDVFQKISTLSGGEKGRVALAKLMLKRDNLLLLDEPTNHLDMDSREVLEHALDDFNGTLIAVSHDRYFINRVCDRVIEMRPDGVTEYLGNYDDYAEKKRRMEQGAADPLAGGRTRTEIEKEKRRLRLKKESVEALKKRAEDLEKKIHDAEASIREMEQALADPATYQDREKAEALARSHREANSLLSDLYADWEEAAQAAEEAESGQ